jgi:hypothetical protein
MGTRLISELIDNDESALPLIKNWLSKASNEYELARGDISRGEETLLVFLH